MAVALRTAAWLVALVALVGPASAQTGMQPARATADELARTLDPQRVALVIGVDDYLDPAIPDLRHAGADAVALADQLAASTGGGFDRVLCLSAPEDVTRDRILAEIKVLATSVRREDVVVIYFSGHGTLAERVDGELAPFLLLRDSRPGDLVGTALDLAALRRFFSAVPARRKALIVDACFNGDGKSAIGPSAAARTAELSPDRPFTDLDGLGVGEALMFATTLGRPAREDDELGHGTYTAYLLQAMSWETASADVNLDGLVTAYEAHDWARQRVYERTGGVQLPEAAFRVVGVHDVVLSGLPQQRRDSDMALVYAYLPGDHPYHGSTLMVDGRDKGLFPGTVAVDPGLHRFTVRDSGGAVVFDGTATITEGKALAVDELRALVREDRRQIGMYVGWLSGSAPGWKPVWGPGALSIEVWSATRRGAPPARGLYIGGVTGVGLSPTRWGEDGGAVADTRPAFWGGMETGWGRDLRRFRLRTGLQFRMTLLPVDRVQGVGGDLVENGWLFVSFGPQLRLGYVLSDRVSLVATAQLQLTGLDLEDDGHTEFLAFGGAGLGVELGI